MKSSKDTTVRIDNPVSPIGSPVTPPARPEKSASSAAETASLPQTEQVELSPLATTLQETHAGEQPLDGARVAEIQQSISDGRFVIHPERIAKRLIDEVRALLARQR